MNEISWAVDLFNREIDRCGDQLCREAAIWNRLKARAERGSNDPEFRGALIAISGRRDRERMLDLLVAAAQHWNPEKIAEKREALRRIQELDGEIAEEAKTLAEKLRKRAAIRDSHGIGKSLNDNIALQFPRVFEKYSALDHPDAQLSRAWLLPELQPIFNQFDYKYWPTLPDMLDLVAQDASIEDEFGASVGDSATRTAFETRQASNRDFIRAFYGLLNDSRDIDKSWRDLTNRALAAMMNSALGLINDQITEVNVSKVSKEDN